MRNVIFKSDNLDFVNVSTDFVNDYLVMINDPEIQDFIYINKITFDYDGEIEWIKSKIAEEAPVYTVVERTSDKFVGTIEFKNVTIERAEIGICITPNFQNKHYGTEILKRTIEYGFYDFGFNEIYLRVFSNNHRAIHCYKKIGFVQYDVVKSVKKSNGLDIDEIYMKIKKK